MASSSSSPTRLWKYDVFLSFRGPDTRKNIVSHLDTELCRKGIFTFKDDRTIEVGDSIPEELVKAIQTSRLAIVVISKNYASSTWCLEELRMIMELQAAKGGISVVPIFYIEVDTEDVRHQSGSFATAFADMGSRVMPENILRWRNSLTQVADLLGFEYSKCVDEATMIKDVVQHVLDRLFPPHTTNKDFVGMSSHIEGLGSLLKMESKEEVRFVGISGMGGVGKTTIAEYLYDRFSRPFLDKCFVEDVKKTYNKAPGLSYLREKFISLIFGVERLRLGSVGIGSHDIMERLRHKKVFAVLDDVDHVLQIHGLVGRENDPTCGPGSRIIIITRDKGLLDKWGIKNVYPVKCLDEDGALKMFKHIAFGGVSYPDGFERLLIRASRLAHGLPYALKAYGLLLHRKAMEDWEKAVLEFEKAPHKNILDFFRRSYDGLAPRDKIAFLHVACLFNGHHSLHASTLLDDAGDRITNLVEQSLVDISTQGCINMHVLVEQTGREIVLEESNYIPQRQKILWDAENVYDVLHDNTGTESIEGLALHMCEMPDVLPFEGNHGFKQMHNVKFLKFYTHLDDIGSNLQLLPDTASLPRVLRLLHWDSYPLTTLPSEFSPRNLVELTLRYSNLHTLCNRNLDLRKLKRLDVSGSKDLRELPDLSRAMQLEELVAEGCRRLKQILIPFRSSHTATDYKNTLRILDLSSCVGLQTLPVFIQAWISLAEEPIFFRFQGTRLRFEITTLGTFANLSIEGDIKIRLQQLEGDAEHLSYISEQQTIGQLRQRRPSNWPESHIFGKSLDIKRTYYYEDGVPFRCVSLSAFSSLAVLKLINLNVQNVPNDISQLHSLEKLDLSGNDFKYLPTTLDNLDKLKYLMLCNCRKLEELPNLPQLQTLNLAGCANLRSLPNIYQLLELDLDNCNNVQSLTERLGQFTNLMLLDLSRHDFQTIPARITELLLLENLCLNNCKELKSLKELPLSLNYLNAHGCSSLKTVSLPFKHSIKHLDLSECSQLNEVEELITQFLTGGQHEEVSLRFACVPGNVVPSYFDKQSPLLSPELLSFTACILVACKRPFHLQFPASSYSWNWEAGGVFQINLRPYIYSSTELEAFTTHHLLIIQVLTNKNNEEANKFVFKPNLQFSQEFTSPSSPVEIQHVSFA